MARLVLPSSQMTSGTDFHPADPALARMADRGVGPAISFQDVSKHFPAADGSRLEVLRDVGFDVRIGDVVAILGPSGSGKSTLLNMAAGLIFPDAGRVVVMGQSTDAAVDWSHVGYMFQDDRLLPWRVAVRNVALALEAGSMPAAERMRRARAVLDLVGLAGHVVMMSARPGRVRRTIDIALPQPRIGTPGAVALTAELRASLEAEPSQEAQT